MKIFAPKSNLEPQSSSNYSSSTKPFTLNEVLWLRDGLELSQKDLPGFTAQKTHPEFQLNGWAVPSLN